MRYSFVGRRVEMIQDVTIMSVHNGYVVKVGCCTFVAKNQTEMLGALSCYLEDPRAFMEEHGISTGAMVSQYDPGSMAGDLGATMAGGLDARMRVNAPMRGAELGAAMRGEGLRERPTATGATMENSGLDPGSPEA
jgi:hypothetical protein